MAFTLGSSWRLTSCILFIHFTLAALVSACPVRAQFNQGCVHLQASGALSGTGGTVQMADGGFATAASRVLGMASNVLLLRTNAEGQLLWAKSYDSGMADDVYAMVPTDDGGLVLAGTSAGNATVGTALLLFKLDANGALQWSHVYGEADGDLRMEGTGLAALADGGFALCGTSSQTNRRGAAVVRTNSVGEVLWSKRLGASGSVDVGRDILEAPNGDLLVVGTVSGVADPMDAVVTRLAADGSVLWRKQYDIEEGWNSIFGACTTSTGDIVLAGLHLATGSGFGNEGASDLLVMKVNGSGTPQWATAVGGDHLQSAWDVVPTSTGFAVHGQARDSLSALFTYAISVDEDGVLLWANLLNKLSVPQLGHVLQAADGSLLFTGTELFGSALRVKIWRPDVVGTQCQACEGVPSGGAEYTTAISALDLSGTESVDWCTRAEGSLSAVDVTSAFTTGICQYVDIAETRPPLDWNVFPNPAQEQVQLQWNGAPQRVRVADVTGRTWSDGIMRSGAVLNTTAWPSGPYVVSLLDLGVHHALVVQH
jgi:hypothetical protein